MFIYSFCFLPSMFEQDELSFLEKAVCVVSGPVLGMLPPRVQVNITDNYNAASVMSCSSRVFNAAWSVYAASSLACKIFGADIDPTPGNLATYVGIPIAFDSVVREFLHGIRCYLQSPFEDFCEPWGEPIISLWDSGRHPEWYEDKK